MDVFPPLKSGGLIDTTIRNFRIVVVRRCPEEQRGPNRNNVERNKLLRCAARFALAER